MLKKIIYGLAALVATVGIASGAGFWWGLPIIGGGSYCGSTVNGACVSTIPAGPAVTGSETIPADTNASGGQAPQTAYLSMQDLGAGPYDYEAPLTGATITETALMRNLIIDPSGTLSALTVVLPAATKLIDGQKWSMCTTQIVTTLTLTAGSGSTVNNAPTALLVPVATGAASCVGFQYVLAKTAWYRTQ